MTGEISITGLIAEASLVVQFVMLLLLLASIASWAVIFQKRGLLRKTRREANKFEDEFWSGGTLAEIYKKVTERSEQSHGLEGLFRAGYEELRRQREHGRGPDDQIAAVQRAMRVQLRREVDRLEAGLPLLATIGSTSPYVGLFGTVWGIMTSFIALGGEKTATLATVAPGIAEALVATAMGLFAAIPAVIGYNAFTSSVDRLESHFVTFMEEFTGILERGMSRRSAGAARSDQTLNQ